MGFVIPVPSSVSSLHFTWYSRSPAGLEYSLSAQSSHPAALPAPTVNISREGVVPARPQIWAVRLDCSGLEAAEVVITVNIAITSVQPPQQPANATNLQFRRKKACVEGGALLRAGPAGPPEDAVPAYVLFFAGVGGCLALLVAVLSLVIGTWLRSSRAASKAAGELSDSTQYTALPAPDSSSSQNNSALLASQAGAGLKVTNSRGYTTSTLLPRQAGDGAPEAGRVPLDQLVVNRLNLTLGDLLLEGTFGRVYQARLAGRGRDTQDVMVKTIVMGSSEAQAVKLVTEGSLLYPASHRGVLPLLATTSDGSSPMMIYQYLSPGNLKKWLLGCHQPVSTHQAVNMGLQLLSALKHCHRHQIVHRDLAARNCYLTPALSVKLSDPALSKDLFPADYHCLGDNENRPVKWMAVESIASGEFSASSDVWAWGVTVWEILTRAQQPFPDVDPFEMETYLLEGFRLHQPVNCPDQLYRVMVSCWAHSPHHRAALPSLTAHLTEFNTQLQQFV